MNNRQDGNLKFAREFQIALIVSGHAHDRAGAVTHQHIIGDPDRNPLVIDRIDCVSADEHAGFFFRQIGALEIGLGSNLFSIFLDVRLPIRCREVVDQRMLRREDHVICAVKSIWPRGEDANARIGSRLGGRSSCWATRVMLGRSLALPCHRKDNLRAFTAPDPIGLQKFYSLRPIEAVEFGNQSLRISGDAQHPLPHRPPNDGKPPTSLLPSMTSSFAKTVPSSGHQFTGTSAR